MAAAPGLSIKVNGAVIGGAIGAVIGIFTHDDNSCQDCHPVETVVVTSADDCDLTRTLQAIGAGPDALAFEWRITQGGITVTITTTEPFLTFTQADNDAPLEVSVASLCLPDGQTNINNASLTPFTPTIDIDLSTDVNSYLGQPGVVTVSHNCPPEYSSCFTTDVPSSFVWLSSNSGSGHIQYNFEVSPASLGAMSYSGGNSASVEWLQTGSGMVVVTATNICSGLSSYETINVNVTNF